MSKKLDSDQQLSFTIPVTDMKPNMIIDQEILNHQGNILLPQNYKIKDTTTVNKIKRILEQNYIDTLSVKYEKEVADIQLDDLMNLQIDALNTEKMEIEDISLEATLDSLQIKDKDFFKNTIPQYREKFNQVFESINENNFEEIDSLETQILESMKIMEEPVSVFQIMDKFKKLDASFYLHCYNMAITSYMLGKWLNIEKVKNKELFACAMLADIGLLKLPPAVRYNPYDLSEAEEIAYRNHAKDSYIILENSKVISDSAKYSILCHHETVDKNGFPFQYDREKIPLFSRIIYIAHLYTYYTQIKKENPLKAIHFIRINHLKEVDLDIFYIFEKRIYNYFIGQKVKINTESDSTGEVIMIDFIGSSVLVKKEDNSFINIPLKTFYDNLAEFV